MTKKFAAASAAACLLAIYITFQMPTMEQVRACRDMKVLTSTTMFKNYQPGSLIDTSVSMCHQRLGVIWYVI